MFTEVVIDTGIKNIHSFAFSGFTFLFYVITDNLILFKLDGTAKRLGIEYASDLDYCCGRFGVLQHIEDELRGQFYLLDEEGNIINEFKTMNGHDEVISLTKDGVLICGNGCGFYSFNGKLRWLAFTNTYVNLTPVKVGSYWLVAHWGSKILEAVKPSEAHIIIDFNDDEKEIYAFDVCGNKLAIVTNINEVLFYDVSDVLKPKLVDRIEMENPTGILFSPDCELFAIIIIPNILQEKRILKVFHEKQLVYEREFDEDVGFTWKERFLVVVSGSKIFFEILPLPKSVYCS